MAKKRKKSAVASASIAKKRKKSVASASMQAANAKTQPKKTNSTGPRKNNKD